MSSFAKMRNAPLRNFADGNLRVTRPEATRDVSVRSCDRRACRTRARRCSTTVRVLLVWLARNEDLRGSDDGGLTWSELWYVGDRQSFREIPLAVCDQAICSDPTANDGGAMIYWAHPGSFSGDRSNYTVHRSKDGASWDFVNRVYSGGAGYSDALVVPDPQAPSGRVLLMAFQKTFTPPVPGIEGGGYNVGLARLPL
jgi:hypothetical protein